MSVFQLGAVAIGGFLGAISRFHIAQILNKNMDGSLPFGTLFVNLIGSFLLGVLISFRLNEIYILLLGTGFLGAFTTFSSFNKELHTLQKFPKKWIVYFTITYVGGLVLAFIGYFVGILRAL